MTIVEFRTITKYMPDDIELLSSCGGGYSDINTLTPIKGGLVLCDKIFEQTNSEGIANSIFLLSDKDKIKEENEGD